MARILDIIAAVLLFQISWISNTDAARILVVHPTPIRSHFILGKALVLELVNRRHDVTFISAYGVKKTTEGLREIILSEIVQQQIFTHEYFSKLQEKYRLIQFISVMYKTYEITERTLNATKTRELISSNEQFDLVIIGAFLNEAFVGFAQKFDCPFIVLNTLGSNIFVNYYTSNLAPPSYVPFLFMDYTENMNFWQRFHNTIFGYSLDIVYSCYYLQQQDNLLQQYFSHTTPLRNIIQDRIALVLLNSHTSIGLAKPLVPNMIEIGGYHVEKPKPIPKDLRDYLDGAKNGFILFSMGSNLKSANLSDETREIFMRVFAELPYQILWKFEDDQLIGKPNNVKIGKWLPQNDILAHPNLKLFITHGGLLSTTEAVYHGVPIVGIPVFADQEVNMRYAERQGIGRTLPLKNLSYKLLRNIIEEIINNETYSKSVQTQSNLLRDQPRQPMDTAMYWIEYVIRHKYCTHLRTGAMNLTWYQIISLDIFLLIGLIITAKIIVIYWGIKTCFCSKNNKKYQCEKKLQ